MKPCHFCGKLDDYTDQFRVGYGLIACWGCFKNLKDGKAMYQSTHPFDPKDIALFEIQEGGAVEPWELPEGVNEEMLCDLWDVGRKWGIEDPYDGIKNLGDPNFPGGISVSASNDPENKTILVRCMGEQKAEDFKMMPTKGGFIVGWDTRITPDHAVKFIHFIDEYMIQKLGDDAFDYDTRERKNMNFKSKSAVKFKVEEAFKEPGAVMPILPTKLHPIRSKEEWRQRAEEMRAQFDEPDKIEIHQSPDGGYSLVAKRDLERIAEREKVAQEVLRKHGIESLTPENISKLSMEKVMELRAEIDELLPPLSKAKI